MTTVKRSSTGDRADIPAPLMASATAGKGDGRVTAEVGSAAPMAGIGAVATNASTPDSQVDQHVIDKLRSSEPTRPPMSARTLALHLLQLCECSACHQAVREPVTLPCGHNSCLACIMKTVNVDAYTHLAPTLPSSTHVPPRLPLASTVVPCPMAGCSRSAIGKGIGTWKGHQAKFGADATADDAPHTLAQDNAGQPPLDGFVVPSNSNSSSLSVIPAQHRQSFSDKYAISKYSDKGHPIASENALLRSDVTLSKVIDVLRRFANLPDAVVSPLRSAGRHGHGNEGGSASHPLSSASVHRRGRRRQGGSSMRYDETRTVIDERFLAVMGATEEGLEPGTVGGVSAVVEGPSEDEEDDIDEDDEDYEYESYSSDEQSTRDVFDDDDDEIGGAFARRNSRFQQGKRVRRHTLQRQSIHLSDHGTGHGLLEAIKLAHLRDQAMEDESAVVRQAGLDSLHSEMMDVLECQLCYMQLYQPLTTPCGHTFCRRCFARSLDHSTSCPLCRSEMPPFSFFQEHPCNDGLLKVLTANIVAPSRADRRSSNGNDETNASSVSVWTLSNFYNERKLAIENEERESLLSTPLFVCTLGFPYMPTILHIFEPRYRLMIRRCLESGHPRFGMVLHSQDMSSATPGMSPYGTMLEIKTVQMLPDGRSMIETVGSYRFRVREKGSLDGYTVGRIDRIDDVPSEAERELEQASMGRYDLWEQERAASNPRDDVAVGAAASSAPIALAPATFMTYAEAREAHAAFQAALGLDSLNRGQRGGDGAAAPVTVSPAFIERDAANLVEVCDTFIETLRSGSAPWLMNRLNDTYGPMPPSSDIAAFGYWMALVMPIDEHEKAKLLPIRSAKLRLCIVVYWIEQLRQTWWFNHGCSVQ